MPKSLLLVLPLLLVAPTATYADDTTTTRAPISSGGSAMQDARDIWFHSAVGNLLEGRGESVPSAVQAPVESR